MFVNPVAGGGLAEGANVWSPAGLTVNKNGFGNIHASVEHANNFDSVGAGSVIDYVACDRKFSVAALDVITGLAEPWVVSQLVKHIIKLCQISVALLDAPALLGKFGNTYQVAFGCVGKLKMGHLVMVAVVQFVNKPGKRVVGHPALFPFFQQHSKSGKFGFLLLQQAEGGAYYFAHGRKSSRFQLVPDKALKMRAKGDTGIFAHLTNPTEVPVFGSIVPHTNSVNPAGIPRLAAKHHGDAES